VVTASAGNHAQGVAWSCSRLGIPGLVVVPQSTPRQKRDRIAAIGGNLVRIEVRGRTFDEAAAHALGVASATGALFVPAFDSPYVVAGQGTIGLEILEQAALVSLGDITVAAGVGGGGMAAGVTLAFAKTRHRVVTVEPDGAASLAAARRAGHPVVLDELDTFVDGVAVRRVGDVPFSVLADGAGVVVETGAVATAMLELYQHEGIIAEPAGALSVAGLDLVDGTGPVVCVISGGNNDVSRYGEVLERSLVHRGLKHYFVVEFDQTPGALRRFLDGTLGPDDDIVLFEYTKKSNRESGPALVGIELQNAEDLAPLLERLKQSPLTFEHIQPGSSLQRFLA
jgi:threonine dehydratase